MFLLKNLAEMCQFTWIARDGLNAISTEFLSVYGVGLASSNNVGSNYLPAMFT